MRKNEIEIIMTYLYNNRCRLEDEVHKLQANVRLRNISLTDLAELMYATAYRDAFKEISGDIVNLLNLHTKLDTKKYCTYCQKCKYLGAECEGYRCEVVACCSFDDCAYARDFNWCFVPK